jgi:hypothetical protein
VRQSEANSGKKENGVTLGLGWIYLQEGRVGVTRQERRGQVGSVRHHEQGKVKQTVARRKTGSCWVWGVDSPVGRKGWGHAGSDIDFLNLSSVQNKDNFPETQAEIVVSGLMPLCCIAK